VLQRLEVVAARILVASVLLALACTGTALADNPTMRINAADQAKAVASLVRLKDFGVGWTGGPTKPTKLTAPSCPGFNPKESDLVVTGHADASFTYRGAVLFGQDSQVLETAAAVKTDFARSIQPKLTGCLGYQLKASGKGQVTSVTVRKLTGVPKIGTVSAFYRAELVVRANGHTMKQVRDFVFVGQGRYEFSLVIVASATAGPQLVPFEVAMAQLLVKRAPTGNVA
jgi:hypothetical protein